MNDNLEKSIIKSIKSTIVNSKKNQLSESENKIIDTMEALSDFLSKYSDLNQDEKKILNQVLNNITINVVGMTIIINYDSLYL